MKSNPAATATDKRLLKQCGVVLVNPQKHTHVKRIRGNNTSIGWFRWGPRAITEYKINGEQPFYSNVRESGA